MRRVSPWWLVIGVMGLLAALDVGGNSAAWAADWPMFARDLRRSRVTEETLAFPLRPVWEYRSPQAPRPAWPLAPRLDIKMDFDYAPPPVVAGDLVYFASSADDTLRALDVNTGAVKWQFSAGGPLRFAPQVENGKVYFGADDGFVYCLDALTGRLLWSFQAAPRAEQLIGNRRMVSRWPLRGGVVVGDGVLYTVAGMWPSEGIYVYALNADTGEVLWLNDTSGVENHWAGGNWRPNDPHTNEFSMAGLTPQGALLLSRDTLIVPLGNNAPASFHRGNGRMLRFHARSAGSPWVTIDGEHCLTLFPARNELMIFGGTVADDGAKAGFKRFPKEQVLQLTAMASQGPGQIHESRRISVIVHQGKLYAKPAYGLALAGSALLVGDDGAVIALDAQSDKELWRAAVDGQARELAVANGRLFVSTHTGRIICFASAADRSKMLVHDPAAELGAQPSSSPSAQAQAVIQQLRDADMDRGYALVVGDADGALSQALANHTELQIINILSDEAAVASLRQRLLDSTTLHGWRIHVQAVKDAGRLPFAQYFANAVIVAAPVPGLSGRELYRVLRPCGGVLLPVGLAPAQAEALVKQIDAPAGECDIRRTGNAATWPWLIRGRLPGARDWNVNTQADRRVKWPLRPIWFGGPDSVQVMNVGIGAHPPVAANGRYFVIGNDCLTAVDAYNGATLWSRPIPTATPNVRPNRGMYYPIADGLKSDTRTQWSNIKRWLAVDGQHVYLRLGENYFGGQSEALIQIDARTGRQLRLHGPWRPGPEVDLTGPQSWTLELDDTHSGTLSLQRDHAGLLLKLTTRDPAVSEVDAWDLFFDFRPLETRYALYDHGAFMLTIHPARDAQTPPVCIKGTGAAHPAVQVSGSRTADGTTTTVRLPWSELDKLTGGRRAESFAFAATLNSHDGQPREPVVQRHLFGDVSAPSLNSGWATLHLVARTAKAEQPAMPTVVAGDFQSRPGDWPLPVEGKMTSVNDPGSLDQSVATTPRLHPLTGEPEPRLFRTGTGGCGNPVYSHTAVIGRSTKLALGFYDFMDDSGLFFFPGIAANCGGNVKAVNLTAALGLLIFSESRSHCECMIPVRTSLAFAPAERRLHEDWAIFSDQGPNASLRQAALNFCALGDRRDDDGLLWLAVPRSPGGTAYPTEPGSRRYVIKAPPIDGTIQVPIEVTGPRGVFGRYRVNADRVPIEGTDRPWLYTSGYRGMTQAVLKLEPVSAIASTAAAAPVVVDGRLEEPVWDGQPQVLLPFTKTEVRLRHDARNLYLSARRGPVIDRLGAVAPWSAAAAGQDAAVEQDDSFELFLSDARGGAVLRLGVSASGARADALSRDGRLEDRSWTGTWHSAVLADETGLNFELAIPWATLAAGGIAQESLGINVQINQREVSRLTPSWAGSATKVPDGEPGISESLLSLGELGRQRCRNFAPLGLDQPPTRTPRAFVVRLHFAELDDVPPGQRVFDVKIQDQVVLKDFDIVKEAGGVRKALVREFRQVMAAETLTVQFIPAAKTPTADNAPTLSALEVFDEGFLAQWAGRAAHGDSP